jgi:L-ascorbate metabolism protein UlaG (beta-lactamase superfamily)
VVTPAGNGRLLRSIGIRRVEELDWWERARAPRLPITLTPAQHFSARGPHDRNRALWGGFTVDASGRRIYFAGDSGYSPMFGDIGRRLGPIDLALLPIGAYEPRWFMKDIHMNPDEAILAHLDVQAKQSLAMHFGTFQLTTEAIDEPLRALEIARRDHQVPDDQFQALDFGESFALTPARTSPSLTRDA